jgi:PAS domain S-box-containing protein
MTTSHFRILVTDDDALMLKAMDHLLTSAGYDVISASNGEQTLRLAVEHHPDLMLLDVILPDIQGTEICRRLKADARTADIFIILLSGLRISSDEQSQGMEDGADGYIVRPIANRELLARIQVYLRVKTVEQRVREYSRHLEEVAAQLEQVENELRLQAEIVENMAEGVLLIGASDGMIIYANPASESIFGYAFRELVGEPISIINAPTEKSPEEIAAEIIQSLNDTGVWRGEMRNIKKDGTVFWSVANVSTFEHPQYGNVWVSIHKDITERKLAEQKLAAYAEHLEDMVEQRTQELREAQEKLVRQEKLAVLGQMAGSVGHELRNPLSVINSAIYYLKTIQPNASDKIKQYLEMIGQEVQNSEKIITDLLDFARVKSAEREAISVSDLILQTLERFPVPPSVEVTLEIPTDLPEIFVDPRQMTQVLGNLVTNACQAMPEGGQLGISVQSSVISETTFAAIRVRDTGTGITPENMKKLFEPLFTTRAKGIGLGLPVSRKLTEANEGRIEVQSEAGVGSTFTVWLPVMESVLKSQSG